MGKKRKAARKAEATGWRWPGGAPVWAAVGLVVLASVRIVSTYSVFNHTIDEPAHIACGMEWLDKGTYKYMPEQPPLSRILMALGPYLRGVRSQGQQWAYDEGGRILYAGDEYQENLSAARLGILPCLWIVSGMLFWWARRILGDWPAVVAVGMFTFTPAVLAHAGLATTDFPLTAFVLGASIALFAWMEQPTPGRACLLGLMTGLAVLSKFSAFGFLPAVAVLSGAVFVLVKRPRVIWHMLLALGVAAVVIVAGYRFNPVEFWNGWREAQRHLHEGHLTYLLGTRREHGVWFYFPVVLILKTPLAMLGLAAIGAWVMVQKRLWTPLAVTVGILAVGMTSSINIGVRHILPIYGGLAVLAAAGAWRWRAVGTAGVAWMALSSFWAHPDYLAYTNLLAGSEPEKYLADSDLDWGQDMTRLATRLRELGAPYVVFHPFIADDLEGGRGMPKVVTGRPDLPTPGWNAVSITVWKVARMGLKPNQRDVTPWPDVVAKKPRERVGRGVLLWYFDKSEIENGSWRKAG